MPAKTWRQHRSAIALLTKDGADPERIEQERQDMRVAQLAERIEQIVASRPPLTAEQVEFLRDRLPAPADAEAA